MVVEWTLKAKDNLVRRKTIQLPIEILYLLKRKGSHLLNTVFLLRILDRFVLFAFLRYSATAIVPWLTYLLLFSHTYICHGAF